ncbi:hypothetical protein BRPE64_BCDS12740 [Caballeronia insecticola]|uniref:Uncharacterized protein n=1 Tax=Caballeronia insecticola TaxID=758793 RepID=R4WXH9_9BURK|nr:hypothetical protein BRPE64_BCDS12740 [Caballeronia insecticola]
MVLQRVETGRRGGAGSRRTLLSKFGRTNSRRAESKGIFEPSRIPV